MKPLTHEEKVAKKQRDNLKIMHNQILSAFSFKELKTWDDLYKRIGYTDTKNLPHGDIVFPELKAFLQKQKDELESKLTAQASRSQVVDVESKVEPSTEPHEEGLVQHIQPTPEPKKEEKKDESYGLVPSPKETAFLYWFQKKATAELFTKVVYEHKSGLLLLAGTGTGKTFITYALLRRLLDINYHEERTWSHIPYLILTKATIVEQHKRVAEKFFGISPAADCEITNIETLRSKAGQYWVKEQVAIEDGNEVTKYIWKKGIQPCVIPLDESQGVKNKNAKQTQIIQSYTALQNACLLSISATPFTRVSEAKVFAISTHRPLDHLPGFPKGSVLTAENWPTYAAMISNPANPTDYNQASVERLMEDLKDYVVRVRGVRPQFDANNKVKIIPFKSPEKKAFYDLAWERFLEQKAKIEAAVDSGDTAGTCMLVVLLKFSMAAEFCHAEDFADAMYKDVQGGLAAVAAVKFKQTLIEIVRILNEKYGVPRELISLVWGGGATKQTKKQKDKEKIKKLKEKFEALGIPLEEMIESLGLEDVEDRVEIELPEHLRLGPQDQTQRQKEIDAFQSGKTLYCLYTLKAGGVGLSLHHTDEFTEFKCRRKESGYAVEEDIPKVPVRRRKTYVTVTYNAIELVQGVGRVPRLTSLSPTDQEIHCYAGTIEMEMGMIYTKKLRCLSAVVKQRESWQGAMFGGRRAVEDILKSSDDLPENESSLIDEGDTEEDEDNENGNGKE